MSKLAHSSDEETMNEIERRSRLIDGEEVSPPHTLEDQFQHFLSYTCAVTDPIERLRMAYIHGAELGSLTARDEGIEAWKFINSQDLYSLLMDVQNGIDSPATCGMANSLIIKLDQIRALKGGK